MDAKLRGREPTRHMGDGSISNKNHPPELPLMGLSVLCFARTVCCDTNARITGKNGNSKIS